jgi:hypothetical protein
MSGVFVSGVFEPRSFIDVILSSALFITTQPPKHHGSAGNLPQRSTGDYVGWTAWLGTTGDSGVSALPEPNYPSLLKLNSPDVSRSAFLT